MKFRTTAVAFVSCLALGAIAAPVAAQADDDAPCATQQTQLDRATTKLADLQAKFAAHPTMKNGKAKKAQAKRVEHAQARLDSCLAAQA